MFPALHTCTPYSFLLHQGVLQSNANRKRGAIGEYRRERRLQKEEQV